MQSSINEGYEGLSGSPTGGEYRKEGAYHDKNILLGLLKDSSQGERKGQSRDDKIATGGNC